jgi:C-1 hydroxylase
LAPDFVDHKRKLQGLETLKQFAAMIYKSCSDFHETIEDIIAEGDKVWVRIKATGTHTGEFLGLAPTGKKFTETSVDIFRIVNGKLAEGWSVTDELDFLKQLDVIEYTEKGKKLFPEAVK